MRINSFIGRVIETTLVHLTAGATSKAVTSAVEPLGDKAKEWYRKWKKPSIEDALEVKTAQEEMQAIRKERKDI